MRTLFDDERLVVLEKDAGVTSEEAAAACGLRLVHRIDRETSGLLMGARDARTVTRMQRALRAGLVKRVYTFVAQGVVTAGRRETVLVRDRGDGLRGTPADISAARVGKPAALEVLHCEVWAEGRATRGEAHLVTGRTHQIRIQLAEEGHPIVGERIYVRDARARGQALLESPRLLLHATELSFVHPSTKKLTVVRSAVPARFFARV